MLRLPDNGTDLGRTEHEKRMDLMWCLIMMVI